MAVTIRLTRMGAKSRPFYRFVVMDSRVQRDGGFIDQLGYYNPLAKPYEVKVDEEKVLDWLRKGAKPSVEARSLLRKTGTLAKWDEMRGKGRKSARTEATEEGAQDSGETAK